MVINRKIVYLVEIEPYYNNVVTDTTTIPSPHPYQTRVKGSFAQSSAYMFWISNSGQSLSNYCLKCSVLLIFLLVDTCWARTLSVSLWGLCSECARFYHWEVISTNIQPSDASATFYGLKYLAWSFFITSGCQHIGADWDSTLSGKKLANSEENENDQYSSL